MGRWPLGRPRLRWVENVRQDATSLGVRDWQRSAGDRGQWKAVVEATLGLQTLQGQRMPDLYMLFLRRSIIAQKAKMIAADQKKNAGIHYLPFVKFTIINSEKIFR